MKRWIFTAGLVLITSISFAQVITPFFVRKTVTQKGGIIYLSNASVCSSPFTIQQNEVPPSGTGYDNNFVNGYIDVDGDASTFMSSSDSLALSGCSQITWAGLYWGGANVSGQENWATRSQVKIKAGNGAYQNLTADYLKDNTTGFRTYHCFKDVTSILQANGINTRYTVANVATDIGAKNLFGGWTIVIIYHSDVMTMRNLTVFEGLANVMSGTYSTVDIPISGFQTPLSGPVTFELGLISYDGDRSLTGDSLLFKGASSFLSISNATHNANDIFNSTISYNGALTAFRNPNYNNTLGYDANIFTPVNTSKNYIGNNAISATIRQKTGGETYLTQVVTSAIDVYEPDLRAAVRVQDLNGGNVERGDTLQYTISGLNIGSDPAIKTYILDTLEGNSVFVPGSVTITYGPNAGPKTDAAGDDQVDYISASKVLKIRIGTGATSSLGGRVINSPTGTDSTEITFKVTATNDCVFLACDNVINNSAYIIGTGEVSGNTFDNASHPGVYDGFGCPVPGSTTSTVNVTGCSAPTASSNAPICAGEALAFTASSSPSATYMWTGPNGFSSTLQNPTVSNVTTANAGAYIGHIYITGKTCDFAFPIDVEINSANAGPDQIGAGTCGLTTITLAGNSPAGTSGSWSIISGTGGSFGNASSPVSTFSGTAGNTYVLRWSISSGGLCPSSDDVTITFNVGPTASVLTGSSTICYGSTAILQVAITGGTSPYSIVLNNGGGTTNNYSSGNNIHINPLLTTTYNINSVTDANGCVSTGLSGAPTVTVSDAIVGTGVITELNSQGGGAASSSPKTAGTAIGWTNSGNTTSSNDSYATVSVNSSNSSSYMYLTNFGFAIPTGATIKGVEVAVERSYTTTNNRNISSSSRISLASGGNLLGSNSTMTYPLNTDASATYGGSTSMWGNNTSALTAAIINASTFGVRFRVSSSTGSGTATARIDYVAVKVYYTTVNSYCDDATAIGFSVATYTNATTYTWSPPSGGSIISGQGTNSVVMNFNGAGQSGNYNVCVAASNSCQTLAPSCLSIPISDCVNTGLSILGNVYWDSNGSTPPAKVDGTGIGTANGSQLYVTLVNSTTNLSEATEAVASDGSYTFTGVTASTNYYIILSTTNYSNGTNSPVASLPAGCSNNGEIKNNITNSLTGNDGTIDGKVSVAGFTTNNVVNVNFGIKINTAPVAVADYNSTNEDTPVTFNVLSNDTDPDGTINAATVDLDPLTIGRQTSFDVIGEGTYTVDNSGNVTFTPELNFNGTTTSVNYVVVDNDALTSNSESITITVNPINDAPVAVDDAASTNENATVVFSITSNDTDVDGSVVSSTVDLNPSVSGVQTSISVTGQGTFTVTSFGLITFVPVTNYVGTTTAIHYTVNDDGGLTSNAAIIQVTVNFVNQAPVALNDMYSTMQNIPVSFDLTMNDIDVDGAIDATTVDLDPYTLGVQTNFTVNGEGDYSVDNTGTLTFTPDALFYGTTTPVEYIVDDNLGLTSNRANIIINVSPAGAPVAENDTASTNGNVSVVFSVTNNDHSATHTINPARVDLDPATNGIQQSYSVIGQGMFSADMNGYVTFQPDWNFSGIAVANYTVKDNVNLVSNIAVITVTVHAVNSEPVTIDDASSTNEDVPVTFNITFNDYDLDGSVDASTVDLDPSTIGIQSIFTVAGEGTYTVTASGDVTFTPVLNYFGTATAVYYTVSDNEGLTSDINVPAMIQVNVLPVNDAPIAINDTASAFYNTDVTFSITNNDSDVDGTINTLTVDLNPAFPGIQTSYAVAGEGTYTVDNSGNITFSPLSGFSGSCTVMSYTVNDNSGAVSNSASVVVTVLASGIPIADNDSSSTNEDVAVTFDVSANDIAVFPATIDIASVDLNLLTAGIQTTLTTSAGTWTVNSSAVVTFTPAANYFGTASIDYTISDDGGTVSNTATLSITVNSVNDAPSFAKGPNQSVCLNSDLQSISNWAGSLSSGPSNESTQTLGFIVTNTNNSLFSLQPEINTAGNLYYTPAIGQSGNAIVSVHVQDNGGTAHGGVDTSLVQTFTITITALPTLTITPAISVCSGSTTANLAYSSSTQSPTTFSLDFDPSAELEGFSDVSGISLTASPISISVPSGAVVGTYNANLYVSNANGCISSAYPIEITVNAGPSASVLSGSASICNGSATDLNVAITGGNAPYTLVYSDGSSNATVLNYSSGSSISISPASTKTYAIVSVTDANGCSSSGLSGTPTVTVNSHATASVISGTTAICAGASANISVSITNGTGPFTVVYSDGTSNTTINNYSSASPISVSPVAGTTYTLVSVTDVNTCTSAGLSGSAVITVQAIPTASVLSGSAAICDGSSANLIVNITGGTSPYSLVYSDGTSNTTLTNYVSGNTISVSPNVGTSYSLVSVSDANTCPSSGVSGNATITVNVGAATSIFAGTAGICDGSSANLTVTITGGASPYSVVYSDGSSNSTVNNYVSASAINITPLSTNTYSLVSVTDANGCVSSGLSGSPVITVHPIVNSAVLSGTTSICPGATADLSVLINGGTVPFTVVYSDGTSNVSVNNYQSIDAISVSPAANTDYTMVSVIDANGCASSSLSGNPTVTINTPPTSSVLSGGGIVCFGASIDLSATITGGQSPYTVTVTDGLHSTTTSNYISGSTLSVLPDTSSEITLLNVSDSNGCSSSGLSGSAVVNVNASILSSDISGSATICSGSQTDLLVNINGGAGPFIVIISDGLVNDTITAYSSGTAIPVSPMVTTNYSLVSIHDIGACASPILNGVATVNVNTSPFSSEISGTAVVCYGSSVDLIVDIAGGSGPYTVIYSDGISDDTVSNYMSSSAISVAPLASNTYTLVSVIDSNGCVSTNVNGTAMITVNVPPALATLSGSTSICAGSSAFVNVELLGGTTPFTIIMNDGISNTTISNYISGTVISLSPSSSTTYTLVSAVDANGCEALSLTGTAEVVVNQGPVSAQFLGDAAICGSSLTELYVNITGGVQPYSIIYTNGASNSTVYNYESNFGITVSPQFTTTYSLVMVVDSNGCVASSLSGNPVVTIYGVANGAELSGSATICSGTSTDLIVDISGGQDPYSLVYSNGVVGISLNNYISGTPITVAPTSNVTYALISVTDAHGCEASAVIGSAEIVVLNCNSIPVAFDDTFAVNEDQAMLGDVSLNDTALINTPIDFTLVTGTSNGVLNFNSDGTFSYLPFADYNGIDSFVYSVCDADLDCSFATVIVNIAPVNDQPIVNDSQIITAQDSTVSVCFAITDPDANQSFNVTSCGNPINGNVITSINGNQVCLTYTPNAGFSGTDSLCFIVCDDGSPSACDTVYVNITVNANSVTVDVMNEMVIGLAAINTTGNVLTNDKPIGVVIGSLIQDVSNGTLVMNSDGSFEYTPATGYSGFDTFIVNVCYNTVCVPDTVTIVVYPSLQSDVAVTANQGISFSGNLLLNDIGSGLTASIVPVSYPLSGSVTIHTDGTFVYLPNEGFCGDDSIQYRACDNSTPELCGTAWVRIHVECVEKVSLILPEGFSPNHDGINDFYVIRDLDKYPNNTISIFNRWGDLIFEAAPYLNNWDGKSYKGYRVGGDELPAGTYFYLLDLGNGTEVLKGYIYLNK